MPSPGEIWFFSCDKNTLSWANQSALFFDHQFIFKESSDS